MSNTSLKPIKIPKLNTPDFGTAISEAFENIDFNFQKLSNLDVNQGAPGRSCVYVPIHLGAAFLYYSFDINDTKYDIYYNEFNKWTKNYIERKKEKEPSRIENDLGEEEWAEFVNDVERSYQQYFDVTGLSKTDYARTACQLIWGCPGPFGLGTTPSNDSMVSTIKYHYSPIDGAATIEDENGNTKILYGNWLYDLFMINTGTEGMEAFYSLFIKHFKITKLGKFIMAMSPDPHYVTYQPVGSFEYWFVDPRYRCGETVLGTIPSSDISCVLRWVSDSFKTGDTATWDGHFEILEIFPTIKVGPDGTYYWFINGLNTGIPVQGNPGKDGKSSQMLVVERIENVRGWTPDNPNGENFWAPKNGDQVFRMLNYAGVPSRVKDEIFAQQLASNVPMKAAPTGTVETTLNTDYPGGIDRYGKVNQFIFREDEGWLSKNAYEQVQNIAEIGYLHRVYRIVGRDIFWTYDNAEPDKGVMAVDEYHRPGDPSCDTYYFPNIKSPSHIKYDQDTQNLIQELDGALAIVLPGPAYKHDRTDTAFWFGTLRAVRTDIDGVFELVVYCSPHAQQTTQLDEHSQAGMMHSFDVYDHKSTSDNRNKPRGLMLPIGSALAASDTPSDTWAAHIIHSDTGGFVDCTNNNKETRRGYQNVYAKDGSDKVYVGGAPREDDSKASGILNNQFTHIINKRILHVGSVTDFRALNYVDDAPVRGTINGAVPGRVARDMEKNGLIGSSNFFGSIVNNWFIGTELHVDEPVTITRYRDLKPKGRLLDVEGDTVIGMPVHKNIPGIKYEHQAGGLFVGSTLTLETLDDETLFGDNDSGTGRLSRAFIVAQRPLTFEPFIKSSEDLMQGIEGSVDTNRWKTLIGRWNGSRGYRARTNGDLAITTNDPGNSPLFSGIFDDAIGARLAVMRDGFAIYNPQDVGEGLPVNVPFSVDALGNIQTYGSEIRSNAKDTAWYFHTKWKGSPITGIKTEDALLLPPWKTNDPGGMTFERKLVLPGHNKLVFASDHELQWGAYEDVENTDPNKKTAKDPQFYTRFWRGSNATELYKNDNNTMWDDPCIYPYGFYHTFGFANETGNSGPTFPHSYGNAKSFGANEYLPTVISEPTDLHWFWGGFLATGLNPRAFRIKFDNESYYARFGGTIKNGLIIAKPARRNMTAIDGDGAFSYGDFMGNRLVANYRGDKYLEDRTVDGNNDSCGLVDMFNQTLQVPIGIWNKEGQVVEKTMIIGGDLVGYQGLSVRGQARAKSFRRQISTFKDYTNPGWAFLLDNGYSSYPAPKHAKSDGNATTNIGDDPFGKNVQTPLVLDLGRIYGSKRLVRFGYANVVKVKEDNTLAVNTGGKDREVCLLGRTPETHVVKTGKFPQLFPSPAGSFNNGSWVAYSDGKFASITFKIQLNYTTTCGDHKTTFRGAHQWKAYGIAIYDGDKLACMSKPKGDKKDYSGGLKDNIPLPTAIDLSEYLPDDFLPKLPVEAHIQAIKGTRYNTGDRPGMGSTEAGPYGRNSKDEVTDAQYGVTFRLDTDGKLLVSRAAAASLMVGNKPGQTLSFSFTYPVASVFDNMKIELDNTNPEVEIYDTTVIYYLAKGIKVEKDEDTGEVVLEQPAKYGKPFDSWVSYCVDKQIDDEIDGVPVLDSWILQIQNGQADGIVLVEIPKTGSWVNPASNMIDPTKWPYDIEGYPIWDLYMTADDLAADAGQKYAKRKVETKESFGKASVDTTYFATHATNGDFLSPNIGEMGTIPNDAVENSWDLTIEKSNGLVFVTLRVAVDRLDVAWQNAKLAGIKFGNLFCSVWEYSDLKTAANIKDVDENIACPKYDLYYYWPGLKSEQTKAQGKDWSDSNMRAKGLAGKADKEQMHGIVLALKTNGEIRVVRTVNPCAFCAATGSGGGAYDGAQPYLMARWMYPDNEDSNSSSFLVTSKMYGYTTKENIQEVDGVQQPIGNPIIADKNWNVPFSAAPDKYYVWVKTLQVSSEVTDKNSKLWDTTKWALFDKYTEPGTTVTDPGTPPVEENWTWTDTKDPEIGSLKTWINGNGRASLKDALESEMDVSSSVSLSAPYGFATVECFEAGKKRVSMWVTSGVSDENFTHRTINFVYTDAAKDISKLSTVLLEKHFNPGYYGSAAESGGAPVNPSYIGTVLMGSESNPYIWYTNDGKEWTMISGPVGADSNYVYVLSTASSRYTSDAAHSEMRNVPAGFVLVFLNNGKTFTKIGRDNWIKNRTDYELYDTWPERSWTPASGTVLGSNDSGNAGYVFDNLPNISAAPTGTAVGVCNRVAGFPNCFRIHKDYWNDKTNAGRYDITKWERVTIPGQSQESWDSLSKTAYPEALGWTAETAIIPSSGSGTTSPKDLSGAEWQQQGASIYWTAFVNKEIDKIRNWFSLALNAYLIGHQWAFAGWKTRKYAMYTANSGWSGEYGDLTIYRMYGGSNIQIGCETNIYPPTKNSDGTDADKTGKLPYLWCRYHTDIQIGDNSVYGTVRCSYHSFDRGGKYLCAVWGMNDHYKGGMSAEQAEILSIPVIEDFQANLILTTIDKSYKVTIDYTGSNEIFEVVEIGGGSGGETYDDSALKTRISTLETELTNLKSLIQTLATTPDIITVNVPAGQSSIEVSVDVTDADGNAVSNPDLDIKPEPGLSYE